MMKPFIALTGCLLITLAYSAGTATAQCTFDILVKTGDRQNAGTDSRISLAVSGFRGSAVVIPSLKPLGTMGAGHNYFERGNLDRFRGTGPCLPTRPCKMLIASNGAGNKPGWFVSYVEVTQRLGSSVATHKWKVDQWLADGKLSALRDHCVFDAAVP
jgi:hypothetical protein